ncbi:MAG: pyridoxal-phosphate dependent enzyme, partial [Bacteroidales bacterium]
MAVTLETIQQAAKNIRGNIETTPLVHSRTLSRLSDAEVYLKFENLQFTASFKERGALNKLLSLSKEQRDTGIIAMSA